MAQLNLPKLRSGRVLTAMLQYVCYCSRRCPETTAGYLEDGYLEDDIQHKSGQKHAGGGNVG